MHAGATLLRQELGSMQARLDQAVAARNVAERRLAELVKGPRAQEITEARAALESARSLLETETQRVSARAGPGRAQAREPVRARSAACAARQRRGNAQASGCAPEPAARRHARRGSRAGRSGAQAGAGRAGRSADERRALRRQGAARRAHRSDSVQAGRAARRRRAADRDARGRHAVRARVRARDRCARNSCPARALACTSTVATAS